MVFNGLSSVILGAPLLATLAGCLPDLHHHLLPLRDIHQFPNPTYLQDLCVGSNGDILITTVWPDASIYRVSDITSTAMISLVHTFDDQNAATGIVEMQDGVFAVLGGRQSRLGIGIKGTFSVFELDLRTTKDTNINEVELRAPDNAKVSEVVHIPEAGLIVGVDKTPASNTTLLVGDSTLGVVWRVDTVARTYELVIKDSAMHSPEWAATEFGISGVHVHKGHLYWNNAYTSTIYRVAITDDGYLAKGAEVEEFAAIRTLYMDNFNFGPNGGDTIWAATNADNRLIAITPDGSTTVVAGEPNQLTLAGAVGGDFGKLDGDTDTLYVITSGAMVVPINGTVTVGGKLVAINTTSFFL